MKLKLLIFAFLICSLSYSQSKGTITGVLTDKESNNETLPFANVIVKGTSANTTTDIAGKYSISINPGTYTIQFSFVGYEPIETAVTVVAGQTVTINKALSSGGYKLEDVVIKAATINRQKESALLLDQKKAVEIKQSIGAQELTRKGVSDVAAAVTKISGVSKQEGSGSVFVRGLGDRYNVTTLNGLPLPSNNPANKNIILDIFSTDIVESIGISKTFESQNYADFGGANVDIVSKKMSGSPYVQVGVSLEGNSNVMKLDHFYLQDGPSYSGFKNVSAPSNPLLPYNYSSSWDRQERKNTLNNNFSLSGGKKFNIGESGSIGAFVTASFDADNRYLEGVYRANITAQGSANVDYLRKSYQFNTNTTVMGTADYKINSKNSLLYTTLFLNSTAQDYSEYNGFNIEFSGLDQIGFIKRGTFDRTELLLNQLMGKHEFNERWNGNWNVGYSVLDNTIPDRMQNTFVPTEDGSTNYTFFKNSSINNHRYYQNLEEKEISANLSASYNFNKSADDEWKGKATLGYSGKLKNVNFDSQQYSFFPETNKTSFPVEGFHNTDLYLNATNFDLSNGDSSSPLSQFYEGHLNIHAVYGNVLYNFTDKLSVILGGRFEQIEQYVYYESLDAPNGTSRTYAPVKFLPSVIAKYKLNDKQNLKFAASNTYTLPQFKEKVKILFQEVGQSFEGNDKLYASTNYNVDLSWELYPSSDEILSFTTFGKIIQNPINEMYTNSSSGNITYANTGEKAVVAGIELEFRKNIFEISNDNGLKDKLSFGFNGSYMYQNQDLSNNKVLTENGFGANFTFTDSKLSGASDFLANADISFLKELKNDRDISATMTYAYVSDKLAVLGTSARGNLVDKAVNRLDLIIKTNLTKKLNLGLSYKNILNPAYRRVTEQSKAPVIKTDDVLASSYKIGSNVSLSLKYKF
ncbi:TonB-dependent receptor [Flavobacterium algicola]|uniref:TonB-dependent receptor n=1 Tax=Flavobacterium algicola TaxID=556529 RepID=UPI001EFE7E1F|nr:TonB-dependent receptor [Flavobacterium algicola]MCG9792205.1 TonB-dependent receptor [Flavobacterium algicola]